MLTAAFVVFFGMTFLQAVATTKMINVFSSGVATLVFVWRDVVDLKLGIILGVSTFLGALLGGRITQLLSTVWLRRIFIAAVLGLALKLLLPLHLKVSQFEPECLFALYKVPISVAFPVWWSSIWKRRKS